jgi:hypothetical protein
VYWTLLTFLDPLAAALLFVYPRIGLVATLAVISTDVVHSLWFFEHYHIPLNWEVVGQCVFLVFVVASFRSIWGPAEPQYPGRRRPACECQSGLLQYVALREVAS